jgi:hypothetical protein
MFREGLKLDGYDLSSTTAEPGTTLALTLYWSPSGPLAFDYTTFVQLIDEDDSIIAQGDGPPRGGWYPTTFWGADEHFADTYKVEIPADASPGGYYVIVGLYSLENMTRLPLEDGADSVRLDQLITLR